MSSRLFLAVCVLLACSAALAQQPVSTTEGGVKDAYPDTPPGLRQQFTDLLRAQQAGDHPKVTAQKGMFRLPHRSEWLIQTFGANQAAALGDTYDDDLQKFQLHVTETLQKWASRSGVEVRVEVAPVPDLPQGDIPKALQPVTRENYRIRFIAGSDWSPAWVSTFVYQEGAFRFLGGVYPFWAESPIARKQKPNPGPKNTNVEIQ